MITSVLAGSGRSPALDLSHGLPPLPQVIVPMLRVLEKMHALHVMHRDIKPENVFLTAGGKFRMGDFGLAVNFSEELPFSRSGTLDYMAPEVLRNPGTNLQVSVVQQQQHAGEQLHALHLHKQSLPACQSLLRILWGALLTEACLKAASASCLGLPAFPCPRCVTSCQPLQHL